MGEGSLRRTLVSAFIAAVVAGALGAPSPAGAAPPPPRWCGTDESATDRVPDGVASYQVHVVYAIPSDGTDRFFERAIPIARDLAAIDSWWRGQDPARTVRFDLHAFPDCESTFGGLDISVVRLPQSAAAYAPLEDRGYALLLGDLSRAFPNPYKKYLVYYEGPTSPSEICGVSTFGPVDRGASFAFTFLGASAGCGSLGGGDYMSATQVHELIHNLGAVGPESPHLCEGGHVCDSRSDIMASFGDSDSLFDYVLDFGRDDYYGHSGSWWDIQDSRWLSHLDAPQVALTVSLAGSGRGAVASDLPGIACPPSCSIAWDGGSTVTLTPTPEGERTRFAGWSGVCSGDAPCTVTMDAAKAVTASFVQQVSLEAAVVRKGGSGRVTSNPAGIDCPAACETVLDAGTPVILSAAPDGRSRLVAWSAASCGTKLRCTVRPEADTSVAATFGPGFYRLTAAVRGAGRVTSTPAGISCTRTCAATFSFGRSVRLAARPARGWRFVRWAGDCRGTGRCVVKVARASLVRATFRRA